MIAENYLKELGFKEEMSPYTGKMVWNFGEEEVTDVSGCKVKEPIITYDPYQRNARISRSQFEIIERKCIDLQDLIKFVDCIQFLYPDLKDKLVLWLEGGTNDR